MNLSWLRKLSKKWNTRKMPLFAVPIEKQKKYLARFSEPRDEIERSYFQYRCQTRVKNPISAPLLNLAAFPLALVYLLRLRRKKASAGDRAECVFFHDGKPENIIPSSLRERYAEIKPVTADSPMLSREDVAFLKGVFKRYPFSWMFWLKVILKVAMYSGTIARYSPSALVCCNEYSFTSSVLTAYCRKRGVKLINVMHGEKMFFMRDSFFSYDECYVWSQFYVELFCRLRAEPTQFKIEVPPSLRVQNEEGIEKKYDFTYYFGNETKDIVVRVSESLKRLHDAGYRVAVRPHPRYSDVEEIRQSIPFADIENPRELTIERSIIQTRNAISQFSTVLQQALFCGVGGVVDDITSPEKFAKLEELEYVVLKMEHQLLSDLLERPKENT